MRESPSLLINHHQRDRDRFMLLDIVLWELDMCYEACKPNLLAISKKIKKESLFLTFFFFLTFLEEMYGCYNVLGVAAPHDPSSSTIDDLVFVDLKTLYTRLLPVDQSESVQKDPKRMKLEEPLDYSPPLDISSPLEPCVFLDSPCHPPLFIRYEIVGEMLGSSGEFSAMASVDLEEELVDAYKRAGIIITPPRAHTMSVDIVLWAMENPATFFQPRAMVIFSDNMSKKEMIYTMPLKLCVTEITMFLYSIAVAPRYSIGRA